MRLGIHFVNFDLPGGPTAIAGTVADTARAADDVGVSSFTFMDHWFQMDNMAAATDPMLEGYTTLGYIAGITTRLRLSLLVTGVTYRPPGLLAKIVTTLDVLSAGRAQLGIGAAWYEREHRGLGVDFPPVSERFERLEETIRVCFQMWSDDDGPFDGRYYHLAETICSPRPLQQPRPPLLVGGSGERKTLRLVARYADACNLFAPDPSVVAHKLRVLDEHCVSEGREPDQVSRTILAFANPLDDVKGFLADMERYAAMGVELVEIMPLVDPVASVSRLGEEVIPALRQLS